MNAQTVFAALLLTAGATAYAQVGHPPESSPYRDIRTRHALSFEAGNLFGSGGRLDIVPSDGPMGGIRYDIRIATPAEVTFGLQMGRPTRGIIDPQEPPEGSRFTGGFTEDMLFFDAGFNLLVTGKKTWNYLAPYLGAGLGFASGGNVTADSSGYSFGNKLTINLRVGTKIHLGTHFMLRFEARDLIWKADYPARYFIPPSDNSTAPPVLNPDVDDDSEWLNTPVLTFGLGYTFRF